MRSWLFVPGNRPKMMEKATGSGADAVILDLEDSVSPGDKTEARGHVRRALRDLDRSAELWVRINALDTDLWRADVETAIEGGAGGIVLPKSISAESVLHLVRHAGAHAVECPPILAIATESAAALFGLGTYGEASEHLAGLAWGAEDLSADLGAASSRDEKGALTGPYGLARDLTLAGAAAAGCDAIDTVWTDLADRDGLEAECRTARRDGFSGKLAIHPAQVPVINQCFLPSEGDLAQARRVLEAFEAHPGQGAIALDGRMIDAPHMKRARRIVEVAARYEDRT